MGEIAAISSAFFYAIAVIFYRLSGFKIAPVPLVIFNTSVALVFFFLSVLFMEGLSIPELGWGDWIRVIVSGILGVALGDVFFLIALNRLGAGMQAVVNSLYSPFVMVVAFLMFGESLPSIGVLGGILVVFSVILVSRGSLKLGMDRRQAIVGLLLGGLSVLLMAYAALMIRHIYRQGPLFWIVAIRFAAGIAVLLIWEIGQRRGSRLIEVFGAVSLMKYTLPGAFFGAYLGVLFWFLGFKYTLAGKAAVYNQLSTIFIALFAVVLLKERMTRRGLAAVGLAFLGALLVSVG